jgi:hypothetical protein
VSAAKRAASSRRFVALGVTALTLSVLLVACGDYDPEPRPPASGSAGQQAMGALTPGQNALGGASAGNAAVALGGSSAVGSGTGGTGGASGTGGAAAVEVEPVEASCQAVIPCGGNVVGTWVVAGSCLPVSGMADVAGFGLGCTAAAVTGMLEVSGTWTANPDGTFRDQTVTSGASQLQVPPECLNVSGTVTTCDRLGGAFQALGYASVSCANATSGGGCTCTASADQTGGLAMLSVGPPTSGTYATANDVLTTSAGREAQYAYCVSGDTLVLTPQTLGQTGALTGTIAFARR